VVGGICIFAKVLLVAPNNSDHKICYVVVAVAVAAVGLTSLSPVIGSPTVVGFILNPSASVELVFNLSQPSHSEKNSSSSYVIIDPPTLLALLDFPLRGYLWHISLFFFFSQYLSSFLSQYLTTA
jgi:type IV secretory pathway protease TraF